MRNRGLIVIVVVLAAAGIALWLWKRGGNSDSPATSTVTQTQGSAKQPQHARAAPAIPATIAVTVKDDKGPIAGAAVRLAPEDGEVMVALANSEGVATVKVAPGTYRISASAKDHVPAALPAKEVVAGEEATLSITLASGGRTLSGTVTDVSGGPVGGARIDAAKLGAMARTSAAIATTLTAADGKYQVTVPEGQLLVAARSTDYAPQSRYVDVGPSGATADFALVPGGVIEGIVLDEKTKQPVAGASVDASRDSPAMMLAETGGQHVVAGEDGRFRITGMRPGVYDLDARLSKRTSRAPTVVGLGVAEQVTDVQILVGVGPAIRGKVVDENNATVAGASVMSLGGGRTPDVTTDVTGAFAIEGLPPGKRILIARTPTHLAAGVTPVELADKDVDNVVVRVQRGLAIKGHVEPRQVAEVTLEHDATLARPSFIAPVTTKEDGVFELGPAAAAKARLTARCPTGDQGSLEVELVDGMPEIILKVTPGASIAGRVVDANGKPVPNVTVMAAAAGPTERTMIVNGMVTSGVQGITNAAGAFELVGMHPGSYRLSVLDRGRALRMRKQVAPVKLSATEKKTGVELAVDRPDGVIKGIVTGPDGKPLADAWVSLQQDFGSMLEGALGRPRPGADGPGPSGGPGGGPEGEGRMVMIEARDDDEGGGGAAGGLPPALTDAQGRFEITGLPHTTYDVVAEAQAGKLRGRADAVTPDATLTIQALGVTSLSGTVKGPKGPAALFTLELEGPTRTQRSFTDGTFSLGRVDPGNYTVRVKSSDGNAEAKVTVAPNTPTTVDLVLAANAVVVGTIVGADGKPLPDVGVTIIDDKGDGRVNISIEGPPPTSGPDGKFRVEHKAGAATLVVMTPPRPIIRPGLSLEGGKTLDVGTIRIEAAPPPPPK